MYYNMFSTILYYLCNIIVLFTSIIILFRLLGISIFYINYII